MTAILDRPPDSTTVTAYDRDHLATYARLLDAAREDAPWREVAEVVLGVAPLTDTDTANARYLAHLERARWLADKGYLDLLRAPWS